VNTTRTCRFPFTQPLATFLVGDVPRLTISISALAHLSPIEKKPKSRIRSRDSPLCCSRCRNELGTISKLKPGEINGPIGKVSRRRNMACIFCRGRNFLETSANPYQIAPRAAASHRSLAQGFQVSPQGIACGVEGAISNYCKETGSKLLYWKSSQPGLEPTIPVGSHN
jgi:hypothetical protein